MPSLPFPETPLREALLQGIYDAHAAWQQNSRWACCAGCSACCTQSVTVTGLEAGLILRYLDAPGGISAKAIESFSRESAQIQASEQTTNHRARLCLNGIEPPEPEETPWDFTPCPFLQDDHCSIYPVRPMMCRAFVSAGDCREHGSAEIPQHVLTGNTVFLQIVEHVAQGEVWGNLLDILHAKICEAHEGPQRGRLAISEAIPGLLVPEEEYALLEGLFASLRRIQVRDKSLMQWLEQMMKENHDDHAAKQ